LVGWLIDESVREGEMGIGEGIFCFVGEGRGKGGCGSVMGIGRVRVRVRGGDSKQLCLLVKVEIWD